MYLRILFPPYSESAIFTMTLSLIAAVFIDEGFYHAIVESSSAYMHNIFAIYNQVNISNIFDLFMYVFLLPAMLVGIIFGAIYLPFTSKDLRGWCIIIPLVHLGILIAANLDYFIEVTNILSVLFLWYSISWFIVISERIRVKDIDGIIFPHDDHGLGAIVHGLASLIIIFVLIRIIDTSWVIAYSAAFFYSSYAGALMKHYLSRKTETQN